MLKFKIIISNSKFGSLAGNWIDMKSCQVKLRKSNLNHWKGKYNKYNIIQPLVLSACLAVGMMVGFKMNDKAEDSLVSTADYPLDSLHKTGRVEELIRFIDSNI
ncbi:MAG: hypothetical protein IPJ39_21030 [Saprospiraceae bacterium]|nr:hypothetical protein [Saprospiraceae bacterium]